jgi:hypothetical protein
MRAKNKSKEIWRTENSEIQIIGVGSGMKKRLENLKTLTWSLESPRQFSHFDVASITKHKIYYEEERGEEDSPPKSGPCECRRESIKWRKRREETKRAAKRMMWSMSCLILLPRNGRRIQCLKALDLMLGTDSSSSKCSVSLVRFFLVKEKEELDAWKLERKLGFTVLTNSSLDSILNSWFFLLKEGRKNQWVLDWRGKIRNWALNPIFLPETDLAPTHLTARKSPHMMGDRNPLNSTTCKSVFFGFVGAKRKLQ